MSKKLIRSVMFFSPHIYNTTVNGRMQLEVSLIWCVEKKIDLKYSNCILWSYICSKIFNSSYFKQHNKSYIAYFNPWFPSYCHENIHTYTYIHLPTLLFFAAIKSGFNLEILKKFSQPHLYLHS